MIIQYTYSEIFSISLCLVRICWMLYILLLFLSGKLRLHSFTESLSPQSAIPMTEYPLCDQSKNEIWQMKCRCQSNLSIGWYPCAATLCNSSNNDDEDTTLSSCGMKFCRHKNRFVYLVEKVRYCLSMEL